MNKIKKLPPNLIAQIAAGEVIERPSFAVKELIDNAIDAKSDTIFIQIENAGLKKISVTDNGEGMSREDLLESINIHTTSKVESEESLQAIASLGFRGEALASIAAISDLSLKSKQEKDLAGTAIELKNGTVVKQQPVGMPTGTTVEIQNMFAEVPARKKFLKSKATELRHIFDVVVSFALSYPAIRFTLIHNKKTIFDLPKTSNVLQRIEIVLGQEIMQNLIEIKNDDSYLRINGYIAKPQLTTQTQAKQYIFVNNRRISDKLISLAVKEGFDSLIPSKTYPVFLLFLSIPYELVDVNVHPRKEQIAFTNPESLYNTIVKSVQQTLSENNITFGNLSFSKNPITNTFLGNALKETTPTWQPKNQQLKINYETITQLHNLYLVVETKSAILMVDQHAAHERILFEQFKNEYLNKRNKKETLTLPKPLELNLSAIEKELIKEIKKELSEFGIGISITNNQILLTQIPKLFKDRDLKKLINELVENLIENNKFPSIDQTTNKILKFLACKQAIKAGDPLTKNESISLIKKLEQTENNTTCPHGRPTKYLQPITEINKLFKR